MNSSNQIRSVKDTVVSAIINCQDIVDAIDADGVTDANDLIYTHIFPSLRIPDTETEKKTYICVKVNNPDLASFKNKTIKPMRLLVYVITHQDLQYVSSGKAKGCTRIDYISECVENLMAQIPSLCALAPECLSNYEENIDARHPCRIITFETGGLRKKVCG